MTPERPILFNLPLALVFDLEVYPGRWCVGFLGRAKDGTLSKLTVDGDADRLDKLLRRFANEGRTLIGYNSRYYDVPVIRGILGGLDPYDVSCRVIAGERVSYSFPRFLPDHIDLAERLPHGGRFLGLKTIAANLGRPTLQELPYPPEAVLTDEQWAEVIAYNGVDLGHTWAILERLAPELQALAVLSTEQGQDLRSTPTPRVVERVFLAAYKAKHGSDPVRPVDPREVLYRPAHGVVRPKTEAAAEWFDRLTAAPLPVASRGDKLEVVVPKARFDIGGLTVQVGSGGLHSDDPKRVFYTTKKHRLVSVDVGSFYPCLIANNKIGPKALGDCGAETYQEILERRLKVKQQAKATDDPAERERLDIQASSLKLVLNSTFGKFGDVHSPLFDLEAMIRITLSGQLLLIDLIERLTAAGARVLSANTDGLYLRVRRNNKRWQKVLRGWERDTNLTLEIDPLKRLVLLATNQFATLDGKGKTKRKGSLLKGSYGPTTSPNALVINDAVAAALLSDIPPESTIFACTDPARFCFISRRSAKVTNAVMVDDTDGSEQELGKVTRYYRAKDSRRRIIHRMESGRCTTPNGAREIGLLPNLSGSKRPPDLDLGWYVGQARRLIQSVPGYRHLSTAKLQGNTAATFVLERGLTPVPKRGKAQLPGSDPKTPSYLFDWGQAETIGTYTGPGVGVFVLDVDDAVKFKLAVDRGNSPLLANRWDDLDGCLAVVRGAATSDQVRTGRATGKLIFRLPEDKARGLDGIAIGKWKDRYGVEIFYGKGLPSILGEHPSGETYRLEGELGDAPEWLVRLFAPRDGGSKRSTSTDKPKAKSAVRLSLLDPEASGSVEDERLQELQTILAGVEPRLDPGVVGWRTKNNIIVGRCPFDHGKSDSGDMHAGYGEGGVPYAWCKHAGCEATYKEINRRLKGEHRPPPDTSWTMSVQLTNSRVKGEHRPGPGDTPPERIEITPTPIAQAIVSDLDRRVPALHGAPTGAGKSHGIAVATAIRYRDGRNTVIVVPTLRLARETSLRLREMLPEAFKQEHVAEIYGQTLPLSDNDEDPDEDETPGAEDPDGQYPIYDHTRIVVCCHSQLGRRGFSKFQRGIWEKLVADEMTGTPGFDLIVDEAAELLRHCKFDEPLGYRYRTRQEPDKSGWTQDPLSLCPKSNGSGNCLNCTLVNHGGSPQYNRYGTRGLRSPSRIKVDADGYPLDRPRTPLQLEGRLNIGKSTQITGTMFVAPVLGWQGTPLHTDARRTAPLYIFRRDETKSQPREDPHEVVGDMLPFAHNPIVITEFPVDREGNVVNVQTLINKLNDPTTKSRWDEGVVFPRTTCRTPRLLMTDLLPLESMRRFTEKERVGVVFMGATLGPGDLDALKTVWPNLAERTHPYPASQKIKQLAIVAPEGNRGFQSLIHEGRLITHPLEQHGQGLIFCRTKKQARLLYENVATQHPTAHMAVENTEQMVLVNDLHTRGDLGVYVTYARGVLGLGANLRGLRFVVADANAFRSISSFNPKEITPEAFARYQLEERLCLFLQNVGRALRGETGKTAVLLILNLDPGLREALLNCDAIQHGCELPPVFGEGKDIPQLVDQASRWLDSGGGDWPEPDPEKGKSRKKPGVKAAKTTAAIFQAAETAIAAGLKWREFARKYNVNRYLDKQQALALKQRFVTAA